MPSFHEFIVPQNLVDVGELKPSFQFKNILCGKKSGSINGLTGYFHLKSMSTQYATALSHIILAGTGIYSLVGSKHHQFPFPRCSFGIIALHSLIGIWRWGNPSFGGKAAKLYRLTSLLQDLLALPCIVTTILLTYRYSLELAYAHTFVSLIPLVAYLCDKPNIEMVDLIIGVNCASLGALSLIHHNYFGVSSSISYAFTHFIIKNDNETYFNVTTQDLYNYAMCFFAIFALKAVLD